MDSILEPRSKPLARRHSRNPAFASAQDRLRMSQMGQFRPNDDVCAMSALPPTATVINDVSGLAPSLSVQQLRQLGAVRRQGRRTKSCPHCSRSIQSELFYTDIENRSVQGDECRAASLPPSPRSARASVYVCACKKSPSPWPRAWGSSFMLLCTAARRRSSGEPCEVHRPFAAPRL